MMKAIRHNRALGAVNDSRDYSYRSTGTNSAISIHLTQTSSYKKLLKNTELKVSSKGRDRYSPIVVHREIEVFHNLTRSPERKRRSPVQLDEKIAEVDEHTSFQLCTDITTSKTNETDAKKATTSSPSEPVQNVAVPLLALPAPKDIVGKGQSNSYSSFQVCSEHVPKLKAANIALAPPETQIPLEAPDTSLEPSKLIVLPAPEDINRSKSFEVFEESTEDDKKERYDSFKVYQAQEVASTLPTNNEGDGDQKHEFSSFQVQAEGTRTNQNSLKQTHHGTTVFQGQANGFNFHQISSLSNEDALGLLIRGLRKDVLEQCLGRLALGICKIGAPSGVNLAMMVTKVSHVECVSREVARDFVEDDQTHG
nr:unnamed protein product [Callosobruchus analis]